MEPMLDSFQKTGYIVMNILNVLGFAPCVFFIGLAVAKSAPVVVVRTLLKNDNDTYSVLTKIHSENN